MGIEKNNQIMNALELLDINSLDNEISNFIYSNFNYFINNTQDTILKDNELVIISKDNGIFKVSLIPNCVAPTTVYIELVNMENNFVQSYEINYLEKEKNSVKVTYKKYLNVLNNQSKTTMITFYDNNKKTFTKKNDSFTSLNNLKDRNCSREIKRYYYNIDNKYVEQTISVGMPNSYFPTSIMYTKFDGKDKVRINQSEFSTLRYRKNNKVLKKVA